jgi:alpha-mannosidase
MRALIRLAGVFLLGESFAAAGQKAWFADGFHGGIYGHYPEYVTQFMVDALQEHPDWRLNLEIEPETWDFVRTNTPDAFQAFKLLAADQSANGRVEFVNPAFGQSYLWNISGESVIQQLDRGMRTIREQFPKAQFTTYCSEEPCFTSALPGILKSFGFHHAVLKNPNTCWGGYTEAFGGELVNWIGPDEASLPAVPRYGMEALKPGSTWETMAAANAPSYIQAAFQAGIAHPIGMCIQDAGWRFGPWLRNGQAAYQPTEYTTWRNYFENIANENATLDWRLSQEDVHVSLVWGAQVLQRIAQQVRSGENRIVMAEKMAALASVWRQMPYPEARLDEAWRTLLLAQHHDCWIVPYNKRGNQSWADKVALWTEATRNTSDEIIARSEAALAPEGGTNDELFVRVFNTLSEARTGLVSVGLPDSLRGSPVRICDLAGREIPSQVVGTARREILFRASTPSLGYNTYRLERASSASFKGAMVTREKNGSVTLETDYYRLELDSEKGAAFQCLIAKKLQNREFVKKSDARLFNEIRGFFFEQHRFFSTADTAAKIEILEDGPIRLCARISSSIASNAVTEWITVAQGEPRIDFHLNIDWRGSPGIGADYEQSGGFRPEHDRKAFYDDRFKLLALFPLNLAKQKIFKDAPFDVTESRLTNSFFSAWSEIKNNVLLNWVDDYDAADGIGMALFTDHTTSYAHASDFPLALTLQYSGVGLWGRDYSMSGPTEVKYGLLPHAGNWEKANLWSSANEWNEPLQAVIFSSATSPDEPQRSLFTVERGGWSVPALRNNGGEIIIRLFNPSLDERPKTVRYEGTASKIKLIQLNGQVIKEIVGRKDKTGAMVFTLTLPRLGIGTLRITP